MRRFTSYRNSINERKKNFLVENFYIYYVYYQALKIISILFIKKKRKNLDDCYKLFYLCTRFR